VEFLTKEEAKRAMEGLKHTHFYGRHLVISYAARDPTLEELQTQTRAHWESLSKKE
jgi:multiple RNA-binding domain-containing protein 1